MERGVTNGYKGSREGEGNRSDVIPTFKVMPTRRWQEITRNSWYKRKYIRKIRRD